MKNGDFKLLKSFFYFYEELRRLTKIFFYIVLFLYLFNFYDLLFYFKVFIDFYFTVIISLHIEIIYDSLPS
jgi:hypothetical protein